MTSPQIVTIKRYLIAGACMIIFATLTLYLPDEKLIFSPADNFGIPVSDASVAYEFFNDPDFKLEQLNGVKIFNADTGKYTYYFEYLANKQDTIRRISALSFLKDNHPSSIVCELMNSPLDPLDNSALTQEQRDATAFFCNAQAADYVFYECYKSPVKHTLLLSKTSDRILHKVEFM